MSNVILFSRQGLLYDDGNRGDTLAIFIPSREQVRRYSDLHNPTTKAVKDSYGTADQTPLWRKEGDTVVVYGLLTEELFERRSGVEVFLPEDFAPIGTSALFYVFGDQWLVHGVRTVGENGVATWGSSKIDAKRAGGMVPALVEAISDRMLEGAVERILVAVHADEDLYDNVRKALEPFKVDVVRFEALAKAVDKLPIYEHRDHGLLMLTTGVFSALIFVLALGYMAWGVFEERRVDAQVVAVQEELKRIQADARLGKIQNPKEVLAIISRPLKQRPSAILHAAGDVATVFGDLQSIEMTSEDPSAGTNNRRRVNNRNPNPAAAASGIVVVDASVDPGVDRSLLVDQERVALSAMESRPWIRFIEREGDSKKTMSLRIGVQVE